MEPERLGVAPRVGLAAVAADEPAPLAPAKALGAEPEVSSPKLGKLLFLAVFPFFLIYLGVLTRVQGAVLVVAAFVIWRLHLWQIRSEHEERTKRLREKKDK